MDNIQKLRLEIDKLDNQIMDLLEKRFEVTKQVGIEKSKQNKVILDSNREQLILDKTSKYSHSPQINKVYKYMMNISKNQQKEV